MSQNQATPPHGPTPPAPLFLLESLKIQEVALGDPVHHLARLRAVVGAAAVAVSVTVRSQERKLNTGFQQQLLYLTLNCKQSH